MCRPESLAMSVEYLVDMVVRSQYKITFNRCEMPCFRWSSVSDSKLLRKCLCSQLLYTILNRY